VITGLWWLGLWLARAASRVIEVIRAWAVMLVFCGIAALTGLFTWAVTSPAPPLPCGAGRVTAACPFPDPAVNQQYLGDRVTLQDGRAVVHPKPAPRTEGRR
jgi:hypothetical protein